MYSITYGDDLLYDPLDGDAYPVSDVSLSAEINGSGSCEFSITKTHPLYDVIDLYDTDRLVTVTEDSHILFKGYVASVDEDEYGVRTYSCTGILSFLKKSVVRPYSTDAEDEKHVKAPSTIDGFFNWLISEHDNHTDRRKRFIVGRNEGDIVRRENVIHASSDSASTTANVLQSELLDGLGGYVFVRYGDDGVTYLDYLSECRDTNAQVIDFGVNLVSYSRTDDATDVATVCYAKGGTPEKDEGSDKEKPPVDLTKYPDGPFARGSYRFEKSGDRIICLDLVDKYGYSEMTFEDSDLLDPYELLDSAAIALLKQLEPKVTIDIRAIDLSLFMDGYEPLRCGELVRVRSDPNGFDSYMLVSDMDLDLESPENTEYTLGTTFDAFTGESNKIIRQLNATINKSVDQVTALDQTTKDQAIEIGKAQEAADNAQQSADQAQTSADNAQQSADNAQQSADQAQTSADQAQTSADNAQQSADTAQQTATTAQETANANKEAIDTVKDKQSEQDKLIEKLQQGIADSEADISGINDRLDAVRQEAQTNFETAKAAADAAQAKADSVGADLESFRTETGESIQNVKDSVSGVRSDVDAVTQKAADLASELDGTKTTVEQVTTDLGEVKTTVSNAATKADQALQVSTSASQTATEAQTTATSAYQDAQSALTQSSVASQTANAVKTELETNYSTTDEIAEQYATKSLVEQTSQSITSTVEATYATKATVEALENIANNAVQTWMGSGVPTLSNKPASDWTTAELKSQHSGDIYYDTDTGYSYRFGSSDGKNYSWSLIKDTDISKAVADAAKAQQTAEGVSDEVTQLKTDIPATYATKTEVKQTTDSIKSSVSEVATTANSALSKATTVEQTANGLQTTVTEQAGKLDDAVTTISQVSQRVDSVSSTITQVSGRVDDVEDKADAAQGTANSALSQASRVEQSLDSFKTSVSRDYQTKSDALSQKSELEQNINSFKTTVSETYTTKDEFNALEIGGTNLLRGTEDFGNPDFTSLGSFHKLDETYDGLTVVGNGYSWNGVSWSGFDPEPNVSYVFSFWAKADTGLEIRHVPRYLGGPNYNPKEFILDEIYQLPHAASAGNWAFATSEDDATEWRRYWVRFHVTATLPGDFNIRIENGITPADPNTERLYLCGYKLERGTKPTAWSPAPEDFDGKYTSKTEFKQTTDKISATATAASQNASSALSKISSLEVSVDGIDTRVEEVASDADEAVKTASQVSQRVDSLSSTISSAVSKAESAATAASNAQNTANAAAGSSTNYIKNGGPNGTSNPIAGWTVSGNVYKHTFPGGQNHVDLGYTTLAHPIVVGRTYRLSLDARVTSGTFSASDYFVFGLTSGWQSIRAQALTGSWKTYSGVVTSTNEATTVFMSSYVGSSGSKVVEMRNVSMTDVTETYNAAIDAQNTANSALSQSSTVQQELTSFKTSVQQTYETKNDALNKQSSLQQSVNNLRTEVSETYTTKDEFNALEIGGTNLIKGSKPYGKSGFFKYFNSVTDNEYGEVTLQSTTTSQSYPNVSLNYSDTFAFDKTDIVKGDKYVISYDVMMLERTYTASSIFTENWIGIRHDGGNWSGLIQYNGIKNDFLSAPLNEWAHFEHPITANAWDGTTNIGSRIQLGTKSVGKFRFRMRNVKLEKGTKPTSWSPAPEDIDENFADLADIVNANNANTASLIQSSIEQTKNSIISQVSASYYTKTEAEELMTQMSTQFQQTENSFEMQFNSLRAIVDQVNESADTNYSNIQKYIRFVDGHIVIGVEGNPFSLDIGNDRISFMQNNSEIAYISNHEFYITSGIITQNLRIGNFEFRPRSNGNLSLSLATLRAVI